MALLYLNKLFPRAVSRDRLYFDRYTYCLTFSMPELSVLRNNTHNDIDHELTRRKDWRERNRNFGGSWAYKRDITPEIRTNCHRLFDEFSKLPAKSFKLTVSMDHGYLYLNDLALVRYFETLSYIRTHKLTEAIVDVPRDTMVIRSSNYSHRSYFKYLRLDSNQAERLSLFLQSQEDIRLSPGLKKWVEGYGASFYFPDYFFIDYNNPSIITMLGMLVPSPIRKTVKIVNDK